MPHVRNLMNTNPDRWIDVLVNDHQIIVKPDDESDPRLVTLRYHMINTDLSHPLAQECRGMVVDVKRRKIVAHPYNKFWGIQEELATQIDWDNGNPRVQEKEDGSIMILYFDDYADKWNVASSGSPTASGPVNDSTFTFADLFWQTFSDLGMRLPTEHLRGTTFMFELCTRYNQVVVRHRKPRLVFHGARNINTEEEMGRNAIISTAADFNWEPIKEYPLNSLAQVMDAVHMLNAADSEGFIVVDDHFNRVKIKSPQYIIMHSIYANGNVTPRRVTELWKTGDLTKLLSHFDNLRAKIEPIRDALANLAGLAYMDYITYKNLPTRKEFAAVIKDKIWASICFKLISIPDANYDDAVRITAESSIAALESMLEKVGIK